jgi:hypothetical protein
MEFELSSQFKIKIPLNNWPRILEKEEIAKNLLKEEGMIFKNATM